MSPQPQQQQPQQQQRGNVSPIASNDGNVLSAIPAHWYRHVLGSGSIILFSRITGLNTHPYHKPIAAIARLTHSANLGAVTAPYNTRIHFVAVAVALRPLREVKETKTPFELARTLSSMLQDDEFFHAARRAEDDAVFRDVMREDVARQKVREEQHPISSDESDGGDGGLTPVEKTFQRTERFAGGLIDYIIRHYNWNTYKSNCTDGLRDPRGIIKYFSILWLYFAIIMPTIAFGALSAENTEDNIGVIETFLSQAFAGIVLLFLPDNL